MSGVEFGPKVGEGWKPSVPQWERYVECPGGCGYMAVEFWKRGAITGVCTKCGHCWGTSRAAPTEEGKP